MSEATKFIWRDTDLKSMCQRLNINIDWLAGKFEAFAGTPPAEPTPAFWLCERRTPSGHEWYAGLGEWVTDVNKVRESYRFATHGDALRFIDDQALLHHHEAFATAFATEHLIIDAEAKPCS